MHKNSTLTLLDLNETGTSETPVFTLPYIILFYF